MNKTSIIATFLSVVAAFAVLTTFLAVKEVRIAELNFNQLLRLEAILELCSDNTDVDVTDILDNVRAHLYIATERVTHDRLAEVENHLERFKELAKVRKAYSDPVMCRAKVEEVNQALHSSSVEIGL